MPAQRPEDGLHVVDDGDHDAAAAEADEQADDTGADPRRDSDLETLRDEFVDAFNTRNLDGVLALVHDDVECPDIREGDGHEALTEEIETIWQRWPGALLTRGFLEGSPCAVGWLPDEDGCWSRAALVCFDSEDGLLSLVAVPDDAAALDVVEAEDPTGEELEEWSDWAEWDRGEESDTTRRSRE